jgi:hypothetical protein
MAGEILEATAHAAARLRQDAEEAGIVDAIGFDICIALNFYVGVGGQPKVAVGCDAITIPNQEQQALNETNNRLRRFYDPFTAAKIMQRDDPNLGCSIVQAVKEGRYRAVRRAIRKLERDKK